jgi:hypothetical protein
MDAMLAAQMVDQRAGSMVHHLVGMMVAYWVGQLVVAKVHWRVLMSAGPRAPKLADCLTLRKADWLVRKKVVNWAGLLVPRLVNQTAVSLVGSLAQMLAVLMVVLSSDQRKTLESRSERCLAFPTATHADCCQLK